MYSPGGPLRLGRSSFFCLLCLNNYSNIFQKRRLFKLLIGGAYVGYPPGGGTPGDPTAPPGVPGCPRVPEKIAKVLKNYMKILHTSKFPQILTVTPILGHSPTLGGASGGQNLKMALPGGYLEDRIWVLWNYWTIFGHLTLFWWLKFEILTLVI